MNHRKLHREILNLIDAFFDEDDPDDRIEDLYHESAADALNTIRAKLSAFRSPSDNLMKTPLGVFRGCLVCEVSSPTYDWKKDVCPDCGTQNKCLGCGHLRVEEACLCAALPALKKEGTHG